MVPTYYRYGKIAAAIFLVGVLFTGVAASLSLPDPLKQFGLLALAVTYWAAFWFCFKAKGRSGLWVFTAFLPPLGLLIFFLLEDRAKAPVEPQHVSGLEQVGQVFAVIFAIPFGWLLGVIIARIAAGPNFGQLPVMTVPIALIVSIVFAVSPFQTTWIRAAILLAGTLVLASVGAFLIK